MCGIRGNGRSLAGPALSRRFRWRLWIAPLRLFGILLASWVHSCSDTLSALPWFDPHLRLWLYPLRCRMPLSGSHRCSGRGRFPSRVVWFWSLYNGTMFSNVKNSSDRGLYLCHRWKNVSRVLLLRASCFKRGDHQSRVYSLMFSDKWVLNVKLFDAFEYVDVIWEGTSTSFTFVLLRLIERMVDG